MNIYISHSRSFDFRHMLYEPLLESTIATNHNLILPYHAEAMYEFEKNVAKIDLIIAEVSTASTGQGIELGIAHAAHKPIICYYKNGSSPSQSLQLITHDIYSYVRNDELIRLIVEKVK